MKKSSVLSPVLFRGTHYGVFAGSNGYYVAAMSCDGVSHYRPASGGLGWSERVLRECNATAEANEAYPDHDCDDNGDQF